MHSNTYAEPESLLEVKDSLIADLVSVVCRTV